MNVEALKSLIVEALACAWRFGVMLFPIQRFNCATIQRFNASTRLTPQPFNQQNYE
jgi:hypothetical protein